MHEYVRKYKNARKYITETKLACYLVLKISKICIVYVGDGCDAVLTDFTNIPHD